DDEGEAGERAPSRQRREADGTPTGHAGAERINVIEKGLALHQQMDEAERRESHRGAYPRRLGARNAQHGSDGQSRKGRKSSARLQYVPDRRMIEGGVGGQERL